MPRELTTEERTALLAAHRRTWRRLEITDEAGNWQDFSSAYVSCDYGTQIDANVLDATFELRRQFGGDSLSPFATDAIADGRGIRFWMATTVAGAPEPSVYHLVFDGEIDAVDGAQDPVVLEARDCLGAKLADRYNRVIRTQQLGGKLLEVFLQEVLDLMPGPADVNLYVPAPTLVFMPIAGDVTIEKRPYLDLARMLVGRIGWTLRPKYIEAVSAWRMTLYEPPRESTDVHWTYAPSRYFNPRRLAASREDISNEVTVIAGRAIAHRSDAASVARVGPRWSEFVEDDTSPLREDQAAVDAFADAFISDRGSPDADAEIEVPLNWAIDIDDRITFGALDRYMADTLTLAVVGYRNHDHAQQLGRTTLTLRGKPKGNTRKFGGPPRLPAPHGVVQAYIDGSQTLRFDAFGNSHAQSFGWAAALGTTIPSAPTAIVDAREAVAVDAGITIPEEDEGVVAVWFYDEANGAGTRGARIAGRARRGAPPALQNVRILQADTEFASTFDDKFIDLTVQVLAGVQSVRFQYGDYTDPFPEDQITGVYTKNVTGSIFIERLKQSNGTDDQVWPDFAFRPAVLVHVTAFDDEDGDGNVIGNAEFLVRWDASIQPVVTGGTGVSSFASGSLLLGAGAAPLQALTASTAGRVPVWNGSAFVADQLGMAQLGGRTTFAQLPQASGTSVLGRAANSSGDVAHIDAGTDGHVLRRSAGALGFGALSILDTTGTLPGGRVGSHLHAAGDIVGALAVAQGGTGFQTAPGGGQVLHSDGPDSLVYTSGGSLNQVLGRTGATTMGWVNLPAAPTLDVMGRFFQRLAPGNGPAGESAYALPVGVGQQGQVLRVSNLSGTEADWHTLTPVDIGAAVAGHTHTFASLTSKPTTLAGYGITDAATATHLHTGVYAPFSHTHAASTITAGTFGAGSFTFQNTVTVGFLHAPGGLQAGGTGSSGAVRLQDGGASNIGYVEWLQPNDTRAGYMGFGATGIMLVGETGGINIGTPGVFNLTASSGIGLHSAVTGGASTWSGIVTSSAYMQATGYYSANAVTGWHQNGTTMTFRAGSVDDVMTLQAGGSLTLTGTVAGYYVADRTGSGPQWAMYANANHLRFAAIGVGDVLIMHTGGVISNVPITAPTFYKS